MLKFLAPENTVVSIYVMTSKLGREQKSNREVEVWVLSSSEWDVVLICCNKNKIFKTR